MLTTCDPVCPAFAVSPRSTFAAERTDRFRCLWTPARLADRQLTISDVRNAIRSRNRDVSGGDIESGKRRYLLRTVGRFQSLRDLENLVVTQRGESITRLVDVAEVRLDHFEISTRSYLNADPVMFVSVNREAGSNVIDIKYAMLDAVAAVNEQVLEPAGMTMQLVAEDAAYVEASIRNVWINLSLGAVFAATVMFLFLRSARATAVGIIGIPICTIAAFIGLLVAGRTINVISLAGVAFAIGMTLDNSIVVIESIEAARRRGLSRVRAAIEGVSGVWSAVLASTLTTILVFIPVLFIQEEAGQLYSDVAVAIAASILASMLVAITLIPTASARLSFGTEERDLTSGGLKLRVLAGIDQLLTSPRRRWTTIAGTVVVSGLIMVLLTPPAEYLPEGEETKVFASMNTPPGYNLDTVEAISNEILDDLLPHVEADPGPFDRGEVDMPPVLYLNGAYSAERLRIISEPVRRKDVEALMTALTDKIRQYPGMRAFAARGFHHLQ